MTELLSDDEIQLLMNPTAGAAPADRRPNVEGFLQAILTSKSSISGLNLSVGQPPMLAVDGPLESSEFKEQPLRPQDRSERPPAT